MQKLFFAARPEDAGISSRGILDYIAAREEAGLEHHAIWVMRRGQVACRLEYAPYDSHTPHMLFSLSKSFCSCAAGFAVQEGLLSWDTRLIDVLPEKFPQNPSPWLQQITLHHLLTMGSGLKPESDNARRSGGGWASAVLSCECDHAPGTHFHYNSMGTYLVSCMVQKVTGQTCRDYLIPRLFVPLGMMNEDGPAPDWDCCPDGINVGGWGLWLSCAQIAPFGQCLLQKGVWDGRQVLPAEWLERAVIPQIDNGNGVHDTDHDWNLGYGYQFWMCRGGRYRGDGALSQFCIVDEKRDMVICCVSGVPDIGKALGLIYDHLFAAADMPPADEAVQAELQQKLASLSYPWPVHDGGEFPQGRYEGENFLLELRPGCAKITLGDEHIVYPLGKPEKNGHIMSCAAMENGELHLRVRFLNAPFTGDIRCRFNGDGAEITLSGVGPQPRTFIAERK